ncbi:MAG: (d)CMP kinase [Proteobacteria bacterium]|nr:(d)CMP kinase [Pseudomonadota bacterium]
MKKNLIITIDGPSGAGKSTVARMVAHALGYRYIDTGAMYRGVAYAFKALRAMHNVQGDYTGMEQFLKNLDIRFEFGDKATVFLDGEDISEKIRDPEISLLASKLSQNRSVREYLTVRQRETGKNGGVVLEGRDTGSVVFPDAHLKFYLDANQDERAKRRHLELSLKGILSGRSVVKEEMQKRDRDDSERDIAPLIIPEHAVYIDTSELDVQGVVDGMLNVIFESEV